MEMMIIGYDDQGNAIMGPANNAPEPSLEEGEDPLPPLQGMMDYGDGGYDDISAGIQSMNGVPTSPTPEVRRAEPVLQNEGSFFDLSYIAEFRNAYQQALQQTGGDEAKAIEAVRPIAQSWSPVQRHIYERSEGFDTLDPKFAAQLAVAWQKEQEQRQRDAADPAKMADVGTKQMALSEKQMRLQEDYRQEMEYQRLLGIMNNPESSRAEWNAARMQLEGLSATIGQRMAPTGMSAPALAQKKQAVGYIGPVESKAPWQNFGPRYEIMRRGSQDRMGLLRQQMEAAGVPVPEMPAQNEQAKPDMTQIALQKNAVRSPSGEVMTIQVPDADQPQPVVMRMREGKPQYRRVGPDGMFYALTPDQLKQLGLE